MNKKLMAVAVAGALGAPALAFAQASTVQIYGTINYGFEQRSATGGDASAAPASAATPAAGGTASSVRGGGLGGAYATAPANIGTRTATPGSGSNFGLRGREDLGGGMYAGFQIELAIQGDAISAVGASTSGNFTSYRNTGVWLGTSVGEFGTGMWDTPFSQNMYNIGAQSVYSNSSNSSSAAILGGLSLSQGTYSGQSISQLCNIAATGGFVPAASSCFAAGTAFSRRQQNSVWWQSPNWSGFSVRAQYGTNQPDATTDPVAPPAAGTSSQPNSLKSSLFSLAGTYTNGPLYVGLAYERHNDLSAFALRTTGNNAAAPAPIALGVAGGVNIAQFATGAMTGSNDWGWNLNARYTFGSGFSAGFYWERLSYSWAYDGTAAGIAAANVTGMGRDAWRLDGAYQTGPHTIGLQYTRAQDISGTTQGNGFNGNATNVSSWVLGYAYSFSKRTSLSAYYNQTINDTNARTTGTIFQGLSPASGGDPKYYGLGLKHSF